MSNLTTFKFQATNSDIRTIKKDGKIYFIARDVASTLGYSNTNDAITTHTKKALTIGDISGSDFATPNFQAHTKLIQQPDVFRLIMRSNLPQAEEFEDFVMEEILPAVMNEGGFISNGATNEQLTNLSQQVQLQQLQQQTEEFNEKLTNQKITNLLGQLKLIQEMGGNFNPNQAITKLTGGTILSEAMSETVSAVMSEIRYEAEAKSIAATIKGKIVGLKKGQSVQDVLLAMGLMEEYTMRITSGIVSKTVVKRKLTKESSYFGWNKPSSSVKDLPYLPVIYTDRADKLVEKINKFIK